MVTMSVEAQSLVVAAGSGVNRLSVLDLLESRPIRSADVSDSSDDASPETHESNGEGLEVGNTRGVLEHREDESRASEMKSKELSAEEGAREVMKEQETRGQREKHGIRVESAKTVNSSELSSSHSASVIASSFSSESDCVNVEKMAVLAGRSTASNSSKSKKASRELIGGGEAGVTVVCSRLASRSEEDDGYCSRSSLDSPVQSTASARPDCCATRPDCCLSRSGDSDSEIFARGAVRRGFEEGGRVAETPAEKVAGVLALGVSLNVSTIESCQNGTLNTESYLGHGLISPMAVASCADDANAGHSLQTLIGTVAMETEMENEAETENLIETEIGKPSETETDAKPVTESPSWKNHSVLITSQCTIPTNHGAISVKKNATPVDQKSVVEGQTLTLAPSALTPGQKYLLVPRPLSGAQLIPAALPQQDAKKPPASGASVARTMGVNIGGIMGGISRPYPPSVYSSPSSVHHSSASANISGAPPVAGGLGGKNSSNYGLANAARNNAGGRNITVFILPQSTANMLSASGGGEAKTEQGCIAKIEGARSESKVGVARAVGGGGTKGVGSGAGSKGGGGMDEKAIVEAAILQIATAASGRTQPDPTTPDPTRKSSLPRPPTQRTPPASSLIHTDPQPIKMERDSSGSSDWLSRETALQGVKVERRRSCHGDGVSSTPTAAAQIGRIGSLSLHSLPPPGGVIGGQGEPLGVGKAPTGVQVAPKGGSIAPSAAFWGDCGNRGGAAAMISARGGGFARGDARKMRRGSVGGMGGAGGVELGALHPLVDHDYCEFAAFSAAVQSSIISTTSEATAGGNNRTERRYIKKQKAPTPTTPAGFRGPAPPSSRTEPLFLPPAFIPPTTATPQISNRVVATSVAGSQMIGGGSKVTKIKSTRGGIGYDRGGINTKMVVDRVAMTYSRVTGGSDKSIKISAPATTVFPSLELLVASRRNKRAKSKRRGGRFFDGPVGTSTAPVASSKSKNRTMTNQKRLPAPVVTATNGRSFVKIPGHYQNEFVYYATKRPGAGGRQRKGATTPATSGSLSSAGGSILTPPAATMSTAPAWSQKSPVGGANIFDWYREMAQTDKSSRFGAAVVADTVVETLGGSYVATDYATTPVDESDVADLVMDMLPAEGFHSGGYHSHPGGVLNPALSGTVDFQAAKSEDFSGFPGSDSALVSSDFLAGKLEGADRYAAEESKYGTGGLKDGVEKTDEKNGSLGGGNFGGGLCGSEAVDRFLSVRKLAAGGGVEGVAGVTGGEEVSHAELNVMAEEVCLMLNSMGEAELKMLASHFSDSRPPAHSGVPPISAATSHGPASAFDSAHQPNATTLLDVDDISDGDLLSTDLVVNMSGILRDLNSSSPSKPLQPIRTQMGVASGAAADLSELFEADCFMPIGSSDHGHSALRANVCCSQSSESNFVHSQEIGGGFAGQGVQECRQMGHEQRIYSHSSLAQIDRGQNISGQIANGSVLQGQMSHGQIGPCQIGKSQIGQSQIGNGQTVHGQTSRNHVGRNHALRRGQTNRGHNGRLPPQKNSGLPCGENSVPELTTVNMFWNDLPGLVLGGREHVRLVDIHKQIMPAKDTGILKKRCLMMGLAVSNCSELQRDFLVRYMGAAKSKSTVVIERNDAIELIGFYVNPKPTKPAPSVGGGRGECEGEVSGGEEGGWEVAEEEECVDEYSEVVVLPNDADGNGNFPAGGVVATETVGLHPFSCVVTDSVTGETRYHAKFPILLANPSLAPLAHTPAPSPAPSSPTNRAPHPRLHISPDDVKRSQRLRNKHVCYADMVHGSYEKTGSSDKVHWSFAGDRVQDKVHWSSTAERVQGFQERILDNGFPVNGFSPLGPSVGFFCAPKTTDSNGIISSSGNDDGHSSGIHSHSATPSPTHRADSINDRSRRKRGRKSGSKSRGRSRPFSSGKDRRRRLKNSVVPGEKHRSCLASDGLAPLESSAGGAVITPLLVFPLAGFSEGEDLPNSVVIVHRDATVRADRRRRSQEGRLSVGLYTSADAACVQCIACARMMSVHAFMRHMHWRGAPDRLVAVTVPQRLQPRGGMGPIETAAWNEFLALRGKYEAHAEAWGGRGGSKSWLPAPSGLAGASGGLKSVAPFATAAGDLAGNNLVKDSPPEVRFRMKSKVCGTMSQSTRHSSRVSKRKQLHPMERYVYAPPAGNKFPPPDLGGGDYAASEPKRARFDSESCGEEGASDAVRWMKVSLLKVSDAISSSATATDLNVSETKVSDAKVSDTKVSDTKVSDTKVSDTTKVSDAKLSETNLSNAKTSDVHRGDKPVTAGGGAASITSPLRRLRNSPPVAATIVEETRGVVTRGGCLRRSSEA